MNTLTITKWKPFNQHPEASKILEGLKIIPDEWALTPVAEKRPYRSEWQTEQPLSKSQIEESVLKGEKIWSEKKQRYWHGYASGYGLRLGDDSGGLIALDVDGASVQQLVDAVSNGDFPNTTMWSSGKEGRYQVLFQISDAYREQMKDFQRESYDTWNGFHCQKGEQLELRYNNHQSVLPFSYHPETGKYEWLVSPVDTEVAEAPSWVIKLALGELSDPADRNHKQREDSHNIISNRWERYLADFQYRLSEAIPLEKCLSRKNRELAQGQGEGNRDNSGIAIAMDAVGCEQWLISRGQAYTGSAEDIIAEYCSRCSPPLSDKDAKRLFKSAQKRTTGSAIANNLGDEAMRSVVAAFFWEKEKPDYEPTPIKVKSVPSTEEEEDDEDKPKKLNPRKLLRYIRENINLRYNELSRELEVDGEELDCDPYLYLLDEHNLDCTKDKALDMMMKVGKENRYNPVKEYLSKVASTVEPIDISNLSSRYLGTNEPLYDLFLEKMLISAVARAFNPGCKVDTALVLQGQQGIKKSTFLNVLGGEWFNDSMGNGNEKDDLLILHGSWIQEWGELDRIFGKKQVGEIKQFLSKRQDSFREPYARKTETYKRRGIITGSVNDAQFLNDPTGSRRFWVIPVETEEIDCFTLQQERDQIWSAAVSAYRAGKNWWLTKQEEKQCAENNEQFRTQDEWELQIEEYLVDLDTVTVKDILQNVFAIEPKNMSMREQIRAANCLRALGWQKGKREVYKGQRQVVWKKVLPQTMPTMAEQSELPLQQGGEAMAQVEDQTMPTMPTMPTMAEQSEEDGIGKTDYANYGSNYATPETPSQSEDGTGGIDGIGKEQTFPKNQSKPKFKTGDRVETPSGNGKITHIFSCDPPQYDVELNAAGGLCTFEERRLSKRKPVWGTENDLPPEQIDQLVIDYLKEHGLSEEYQIICHCQQKTPEVRAALQRVAIRVCGDKWETFWNLGDSSNA